MNKDRLSLREAVAYTRRGFAIWCKAAPEVLVSAAAVRAVNALAPYLPLWFTARLVNAIAGGEPGAAWPMLAGLLISPGGGGAVRAAARGLGGKMGGGRPCTRRDRGPF